MMRAKLGLAAVYLLAGGALFVIGPFVGTTRVPSEVFVVTFFAWTLGLVLLPVLGVRNLRRLVLGAVVVIGFVLVGGAVVSGGLRVPFGY